MSLKGDVDVQVNGQMEIDREQMWELIERPSVEHAAEVWWSEGRSMSGSWSWHR